jgi:hypothetical protein
MTTADKAAGAIREALAAGPTLDWHQGPYGELHGADGRIVTFANAGVAFGSAYDHPEREANTRFLHAASPAALVAILDEMDRLRGLEASRIAYASEFPPNADGEPDVGNIHANLRALKAELERLRGVVSAVWADVTDIETDACLSPEVGKLVRAAIKENRA